MKDNFRTTTCPGDVGIRKPSGLWRSGKLLCCALVAVLTTVAMVSQTSSAVGASTAPENAISALPGIAAARSSVLKAQDFETLNKNLVSQLSSEANSRFLDTCESEPGKPWDSPAAVACDYGDKSAQNVLVLYGDSYAEQWIPALDSLGKQDHFKVVAYVRYGCPFAAVNERDYLGTVDSGCPTYRNNVIAAINSMVPAPSLTLLAESHFRVELAPNGSTLSFKAWANGIRWSLAQLHVRPLGVLIGTPIADNDPGYCLSIHWSHIQECATPSSQAYSFTRDKEDSAAIVASHAVVVNLSSLFCGARCPEVVNDHLVFADSDHVDQSYARQLTTALGSLISCMTTEVPPAQNPPGGVLSSLLQGTTEPSIASACKAVNEAPYNF